MLPRLYVLSNYIWPTTSCTTDSHWVEPVIGPGRRLSIVDQRLHHTRQAVTSPVHPPSHAAILRGEDREMDWAMTCSSHGCASRLASTTLHEDLPARAAIPPHKLFFLTEERTPEEVSPPTYSQTTFSQKAGKRVLPSAPEAPGSSKRECATARATMQERREPQRKGHACAALCRNNQTSQLSPWPTNSRIAGFCQTNAH